MSAPPAPCIKNPQCYWGTLSISDIVSYISFLCIKNHFRTPAQMSYWNKVTWIIFQMVTDSPSVLLHLDLSRLRCWYDDIYKYIYIYIYFQKEVDERKKLGVETIWFILASFRITTGSIIMRLKFYFWTGNLWLEVWYTEYKY